MMQTSTVEIGSRRPMARTSACTHEGRAHQEQEVDQNMKAQIAPALLSAERAEAKGRPES